MDYVLLLRGVNVGGNHRVVMAELCQHLENAGCENVKSYINSGNLLLESSEENIGKLVDQVLKTHYDFPIHFVVIAGPTYLAAVKQAPDWWGKPGDFRHNALFKLPGYLLEFDDLILGKATSHDEIAFQPQLIFWTSPQKVNYSRAFYAKMLPEPFYPVVSIRNRNTTLKLAKLLAERETNKNT